MKLELTSQIIGERRKPNGSDSASKGAMRGTVLLLAEVLMFKGMRVSDMDTSLGFEVVELVCAVGIAADEGLEMELWGRDWEDGEERVLLG
jgi:hypothetical protein